ELRGHLGFDIAPSAVRISRWPKAFPQYRPHHGTILAAAEGTLPPGLSIAGASYHGIGIPACIRSGQQAAATVLQRCSAGRMWHAAKIDGVGLRPRFGP